MKWVLLFLLGGVGVVGDVFAGEWVCAADDGGGVGCYDNETGYIFDDPPDAGCRVRDVVGGIACKKRDFGFWRHNTPASVKYHNRWGYTDELNCHYSLSADYDFVCR